MKYELLQRVPLGRVLTHQEEDNNFDRLDYWSGPWAAGTYTNYEAVSHRGRRWICVVPSTTTEPGFSTDWQLTSSPNVYQGTWAAGTYLFKDIVTWVGGLWICNAATTTGEPGVSADWSAYGRDYFEIWEFTAGPLAVPGVTQVPLTLNPLTPTSPFFTPLGGDLRCDIDVQIRMLLAFIWRPTIANNEDAGIVFDAVLRVATGGSTIPIKDPYGNLFQSSRANSADFGGSQQIAIANMKTNDVIGIDTSNYTAQTGTTELLRLHMYVQVSR